MTVHRLLALMAAALGFGAWLVDPASTPARSAEAGQPRFISAPELAARIVSRDPALRVFDLRSRAEYDRFHVPGAVHATTGALAREPVPPDGTAVVYANRLAHATRGWATLSGRVVRDVRILRGGAYEWIVRIHEPRVAVDATTAERAAFDEAARFSRFFGGRAHEGVPRAQVPAGYWTGATTTDRSALEETLIAVAAIRRRGC
jgi:rhodanese-related sulfurtransferase